jgi:hypothetical protein
MGTIYFHAKVPEIGSVRHLRSSQNHLGRLMFQQVNQTCVAIGDLRRETDNFAQHFVERSLRTYHTADTV